jgi:hypothetical protein
VSKQSNVIKLYHISKEGRERKLDRREAWGDGKGEGSFLRRQ